MVSESFVSAHLQNFSYGRDKKNPVKYDKELSCCRCQGIGSQPLFLNLEALKFVFEDFFNLPFLTASVPTVET